MKRKEKRHPRRLLLFKQAFALFLCFVLFLSAVPAVTAAFAAGTATEEPSAAAGEPAAPEDTPPADAPAAAPVAPANNRTVRAGVFFFDGYHMRDDEGGYSGYGIELLNLISRYSHLNFEFVGYENSWAEMQQMLLNGEIDVVTSARKTRERTELYLFSQPIDLNTTVLSVRADNMHIVSGNYSTYAGMTVGLLAGNSQNRFLPEFAEENGFTMKHGNTRTPPSWPRRSRTGRLTPSSPAAFAVRKTKSASISSRSIISTPSRAGTTRN